MSTGEHRTCARCGQDYNVARGAWDEKAAYVCQDCAERGRALLQHRRPRLIYNSRGMATVKINGE